MPTILYEDSWVVVSLDAARGLVRYTRSALPYATLEELERSFDGMRDLAAPVLRGTKLLIDLRLAPPRNDPVFEARTRNALDGLTKRFVRIATLVRTAVGKLQSARLAKERGAESHVFDDEDAALAYLDVG